MLHVFVKYLYRVISLEIESTQINENHSKYWKNVLEGERILSAIDNSLISQEILNNILEDCMF
jgi:hypothetical protein